MNIEKLSPQSLLSRTVVTFVLLLFATFQPFSFFSTSLETIFIFSFLDSFIFAIFMMIFMIVMVKYNQRHSLSNTELMILAISEYGSSLLVLGILCNIFFYPFKSWQLLLLWINRDGIIEIERRFRNGSTK